MTQHSDDQRQGKISPAFTARLAHLTPQQTVRAVVLLRSPVSADPTAPRAVRAAKRQALIEALRHAAAPELLELDQTLERYYGKRLAASVNALGAVPVETTAAGIHALAASPYVKAILEDQTIFPLERRYDASYPRRS